MTQNEVDSPITVGTLKQALAGLPDDWFVVIDDERHGASWTLGEIVQPWRLSTNADGSRDYWQDDEQSRSDYGNLGEETPFDELPFGVLLYPNNRG